jgi:NAD(P)-dependent dehydrogenase (short-subunit alcohol dehydrogenase family)
MSVSGWFKPVGPSGFGYSSTAEDVTEGLDLRGRRILITGCNSGIGLETMRVLALRGATVIGTARTTAKATEAAATMTGTIEAVACELSDPPSVRACVTTVAAGAPLDAIVCNAGVMALPRHESRFGVEMHLLTNHVGHFLLVTGLLDRLAPHGRVVMLSSGAHHNPYEGGIAFDNLEGSRGYDQWKAYGQSKLANLLFSNELARRFAGTGKTSNAVHPGVIRTNLVRHMPGIAGFAMTLARPLLFKSIPEGAATQTWAATHPSLQGVSGEYFADCNTAPRSRYARDPELAARLWQATEAIVAGLPA